ncbi:MAG TPA: hypothetical protein VES02_12630 [Dermatophilaceae bacterium]|nr:hypothetical protein [Dermatophilaceae bacterium]
MSTDLESDLRREFDTVRSPSRLTFSPESVMHTGKRAIRRRRIIATGSAAMAVALVAAGATLLTRPDDRAGPQPATRTATTGIARAQAGFIWGHADIQFTRAARGEPNVRYSAVGPDGRRHELGVSSTGEPGEKSEAFWKSGMVDGHPVTIGLFPGYTSDPPVITFADGISYAIGSEELKGTGYTMFFIDYSAMANQREPARPSTIASIRWSDYGIVEGIECGRALTGRVLSPGRGGDTQSVEVVLRPAGGGRSTVFGQIHAQDGGSTVGSALSAATTNNSGVAVVTGRTPVLRRTTKGLMSLAGPPLAAGVLPPGASDIGVVLSTNDAMAGTAASDRMPDGSVIFAITGDFSRSSDRGKDSIKAVTWTNADGTRGRIAVTQKQ